MEKPKYSMKVHEYYRHVTIVHVEFEPKGKCFFAESIGKNSNTKIKTYCVVDTDIGRAVLWDVPFGAITVITSSEVPAVCEDEENIPTPCYIFGMNKGRGHWTQMDVNDLDLVRLDTDGNKQGVFTLLSEFLI